ncbi:MAG TPA: hypothetical protein H9896_05175, partial [Candidatus Pygmaiobacter gallistercoris]|nr:hypothetical protein [Candidatus Pygmaiobacter gallistercoris]
SHFLHPKFWGRTAGHRKKVDFDAGARKNVEGTLCGCRGQQSCPDVLTLQPRKSSLFTALFSYPATPLWTVLFWWSNQKTAMTVPL